VFLLTLVMYLRARQEPARTIRLDLYAALDNLPHVFDHDLDARSHAELRDRLTHARDHAHDRNLALLAGALLEVVESEYVELARRPRSRWERWADRLRTLEASWFTLGRTRLLLAAVLLAMGAGAFGDLLILLWTTILPLDLERAVYIISGGADQPGGTRLFLLFTRFVLAGIVGMLLVLGAALLALRRVHAGIACGYFGLLLSLTTLSCWSSTSISSARWAACCSTSPSCSGSCAIAAVIAWPKLRWQRCPPARPWPSSACGRASCRHRTSRSRVQGVAIHGC
jgi:hypothetical protein